MDTITMWAGLADKSGEELPVPRVQVQFIRKSDGTYGSERGVSFGIAPISATVARCKLFLAEFGGCSVFEVGVQPPCAVCTGDTISLGSVDDMPQYALAPFAQSDSFDEWMAKNGGLSVDPKALWDAAFIAGSRFMHTLTARP